MLLGKLYYLLSAGKIFRNEVEKLTLFAVLLGIIQEFGKAAGKILKSNAGKHRQCRWGN
jgi:hypothetical protein